MERIHSRGQHLCKFMGTKEIFYIRKEFNSHRIGLEHQHGRRFIVLENQYGRREVMWIRSICRLAKERKSARKGLKATSIAPVGLHNLTAPLRSLSNDIGDVSENGKKAIGLDWRKQQHLHVHHAFLCISFPSLHDYNVKMPNFTFWRGRENTKQRLSYSFLELRYSLSEFKWLKKLPTFDELNKTE